MDLHSDSQNFVGNGLYPVTLLNTSSLPLPNQLQLEVAEESDLPVGRRVLNDPSQMNSCWWECSIFLLGTSALCVLIFVYGKMPLTPHWPQNMNSELFSGVGWVHYMCSLCTFNMNRAASSSYDFVHSFSYEFDPLLMVQDYYLPL